MEGSVGRTEEHCRPVGDNGKKRRLFVEFDDSDDLANKVCLDVLFLKNMNHFVKTFTVSF